MKEALKNELFAYRSDSFQQQHILQIDMHDMHIAYLKKNHFISLKFLRNHSTISCLANFPTY